MTPKRPPSSAHGAAGMRARGAPSQPPDGNTDLRSCARRVRTAAALAVVLTSLWSASGAIDSEDAQTRLRVAEQLAAEGRLVVASYGDGRHDTRLRDAAGVYSSRFGIGQSLFYLPFVLITRPLAAVAPVPDSLRMKLGRFLLATSVFAVVLLATFGLCVLNARALGAGRLPAYFAAFVAVFGSSFWQMAKQGQEENQLAIAALAALLGFLGWRQTGRPACAWLTAVALSSAIVFRPTAVTMVLGFVGLYAIALWRAARRGVLTPRAVTNVVIAFVLAGATGTGIVLGYNLFKGGHPLRFGYGSTQGVFSSSTWWDGVWGSTVGLDRGIIWQNLWMLPAVLLVIFGWRRLRPRLRVAVVLGGILFLGSVALYSGWSGWAGGLHTYGTRFQQHVVPLLALGLILGALEVAGRARRWSASSAVVLALVAAVLQLPSIAFVHNLEALQAMTSRATAPAGEIATVAMGGQLHLRHANVLAKLTTGRPVPIDTLRSEPRLAGLLADSSRWDFWPWRIPRYVGSATTLAARLLWIALLLCSLGAWVVVFRRAAQVGDDG